MIRELCDARSMLQLREQELVGANMRLHTEVMERRSVEEKLRLSNETLQKKLKKIKKLQNRLKEELIRDSLTGLFNRQYLMEAIDHDVAAAVRGDRPVSVLLMDIDIF